MAYEWSYNTHYACLKYQHDEKIRLFYGILNEEIDQELYFTQLHYLSVLLSLLQNGVSSQEEFRNILAGLFVKPRTEEELDLLVQAAQLELEDTEISEDHQRLLCEVSCSHDNELFVRNHLYHINDCCNHGDFHRLLDLIVR